jgi:hypothetical protein
MCSGFLTGTTPFEPITVRRAAMLSAARASAAARASRSLSTPLPFSPPPPSIRVNAMTPAKSANKPPAM